MSNDDKVMLTEVWCDGEHSQYVSLPDYVALQQERDKLSEQLKACIDALEQIVNEVGTSTLANKIACGLIEKVKEP